MKRLYLLTLFLIVTMALFVSAEAGKVNLINDQTDILQTAADAEFSDGVFSMSNSNQNYLASFKVPGLTDKYIWSGDVKILEFGDDAYKPAGVRFCVGFDTDTGDYLNLIITRSIGIAAERGGPNPLNDVYKLSKEHYAKVIDPGSEFHFEITRDGSHIILKIDDVVAMDYVFPEEFSFFSEGDDYNLGFFAVKCAYEVRNLAVYCEDVVITPVPTASPEPTPSPVPTDTPEKTQAVSTATVKPVTTDKPDTKTEQKAEPLVIGIASAAGLLAVVAAVVIIIRKKRA